MIIYIFSVIQICLISCFFLNIVSAAPPSFFGGYHIQSRKLGNFRCPNNCSGHGNCNNDYHCKCWAGWGYTGPDCSKRLCPYDIAWADKAYTTDTAHSLAECSNQGICNTVTGKCQCFQGFDGLACEKSSCGATSCNGVGECITIGELYKQYTATTNTVKTYTNWEYNHTTTCVCKNGYTGPACQHRVCPRGDDPVTTSNGYRTIIISTSARTGVLAGSFLFYFQDRSFLFPANQKYMSSSKCKTLFESLSNVGTVSCSVINIDLNHGGIKLMVAFNTFPTLPYENNIYYHDGNPSLNSFYCDTSLLNGTAGGVVCNITNYNTNYIIPEYEYCSNRGICNFGTGRCKCFTGFTNSNCDTYSTLLRSSKRLLSSNVLTMTTSNNSKFEGNVVGISTYDLGTTSFSFLKAVDEYKTIFNIDGYGNINMSYGGLRIRGYNKLNVSNPNIYTNGGETIYYGGLNVAGGLSIANYGFNNTINPQSLIINVLSGGAKVDSGGLTIYSGGLIVNTGGLTISSDGLVINGGLTTYAGGMTISGGGLKVSGGVTVIAGGLIVFKRGLTIYSGGLNVNSGGVQLVGKLSSAYVTDGVSVNSGGCQITGGLSVMDEGLYQMNGGLTVASGGFSTTIMNILDSGLTITNGLTINNGGLNLFYIHPVYNLSNVAIFDSIRLSDGLYLTGGLSIQNEGLRVTDGVIISDSGLAVTGSVTIDDGFIAYTRLNLVSSASGDALSITTGGMTVYDQGLKTLKGLTVTDKGLSVYSLSISGLTGITVDNKLITPNLFVTGGLTLSSGGIKTTGGITISNRGLYSASLITVSDSGLFIVTSGITINNDGLKTTLPSGLTISSGGLNIQSGGLTVSDGGLKVFYGLTIQNMGLIITNGATVMDLGIKISNGLTISDSGIHCNGAVSINNLGLSVTNLEMQSLGCGVTGGITIFDSGLRVTNGLSVLNGGGTISLGGIQVEGIYGLSADSLTIYSGGLSELTSGVYVEKGLFSSFPLTVPDNGIKVTGAVKFYNSLNIASGSLSISAGMRTTGIVNIQNGIKIGGDVTINSGFRLYPSITISDGKFSCYVLNVASGLTIRTGGLKVYQSDGTNGLKINSGGISSADKITIYSGLIVSGGISVRNLGLSLDYLTIYNSGLRIYGGLIVQSGSLGSNNGITIKTGGLHVTDGMTVSSSGLWIANNVHVATGSVVVNNDASVGSVNIVSNDLYVGSGNIPDFGSIILPRANNLVVNGNFQLNCESNVGHPDNLYPGCGLVSTYYNYLGGHPTTQPTAQPTIEPVTPSDIRIKSNISTISDSLHKVRSIKGIYFNWKERIDEQKQLGVLAQDVNNVLPEVIRTTGNKGYMSVLYEEIIPLLVEAIKDLNVQVEDNNLLKVSERNCNCSEPDLTMRLNTLLQSVESLEKEESDITNLLLQLEMNKLI